MNRDEFRAQMKDYVPEGTIDWLYLLLSPENLEFRISRDRKTKLGDYRPPLKINKHRISVNASLLPEEFLITSLHELAHLYTWEKYKNSVKPHGKEWQTAFKDLLVELIKTGELENEFSDLLYASFIKNSTPASTQSISMSKYLSKKYHKKTLFLADIPLNNTFRLTSGREFIKLEKLRSRYKCKDTQNKRIYLINEKVEVMQ